MIASDYFLAYGMNESRHIDAVYVPEGPQNTPFAYRR